jgi:hypothetical protein
MPFSFILELHGWWHIFTGIGAYVFIALVEYLTSEDAGLPVYGRFAWPLNWVLREYEQGRRPTLPKITSTDYGTIGEDGQPLVERDVKLM